MTAPPADDAHHGDRHRVAWRAAFWSGIGAAIGESTDRYAGHAWHDGGPMQLLAALVSGAIFVNMIEPLLHRRFLGDTHAAMHPARAGAWHAVAGAVHRSAAGAGPRRRRPRRQHVRQHGGIVAGDDRRHHARLIPRRARVAGVGGSRRLGRRIADHAGGRHDSRRVWKRLPLTLAALTRPRAGAARPISGRRRRTHAPGTSGERASAGRSYRMRTRRTCWDCPPSRCPCPRRRPGSRCRSPRTACAW